MTEAERRKKFPEWRAFDEQVAHRRLQQWLVYATLFALSVPMAGFGWYLVLFQFGQDMAHSVTITVLGTLLVLATGAPTFGIVEVEG